MYREREGERERENTVRTEPYTSIFACGKTDKITFSILLIVSALIHISGGEASTHFTNCSSSVSSRNLER